MSIKKLTAKLDDELTKAWAEYIDLHNALNTHRGKPLEDTDLPEVNRLIKAIEDKFEDMYHAFHFINYRHQMAINASVGYEDFIRTLVAAGAIEEPKHGTSKIIEA